MMADLEHHTLAPSNLTSPVDSHTPQETLHLAEQVGIAKANLSWTDLIVKSFLAGIFISIGGAFDLDWEAVLLVCELAILLWLL